MEGIDTEIPGLEISAAELNMMPKLRPIIETTKKLDDYQYLLSRRLQEDVAENKITLERRRSMLISLLSFHVCLVKLRFAIRDYITDPKNEYYLKDVIRFIGKCFPLVIDKFSAEGKKAQTSLALSYLNISRRDIDYIIYKQDAGF